MLVGCIYSQLWKTVWHFSPNLNCLTLGIKKCTSCIYTTALEN